MMPISSPFRERSLLSPRTVKYVEAMVRQGDKFDYDEWLESVREEEAQGKQPLATSDLSRVASAEIGKRLRLSASPARQTGRRATTASAAKAMPAMRPIRRSGQDLRGNTSKGRLRQWLERVQGAWQDFQANRARDAIYDYLEAVFAIVMHFKVRRHTKRLLRHAFKLANLRSDNDADLFTAIIRCTCGDGADNKMISKWARALRYAVRRKPPAKPLRAFMKDAGGINECAAGYANVKRRRQ